MINEPDQEEKQVSEGVFFFKGTVRESIKMKRQEDLNVGFGTFFS